MLRYNFQSFPMQQQKINEWEKKTPICILWRMYLKMTESYGFVALSIWCIHKFDMRELIKRANERVNGSKWKTDEEENATKVLRFVNIYDTRAHCESYFIIGCVNSRLEWWRIAWYECTQFSCIWMKCESFGNWDMNRGYVRLL